jgi:hypothetical protein
VLLKGKCIFGMSSTLNTQSVFTGKGSSADSIEPHQFLPVVQEVLSSTAFIDMHTHLFSPALGKLGLWGIDELVTYHYLEAEFFRSSSMTPEHYWALEKRQQADVIWRVLFVENTPLSEATRGVVAILQAFGLPTDGVDLKDARAFFAAQTRDDHIRRVFEMAGINTAVMTNDPLDPIEGPLWMKGLESDRRFQPVLRLDRILLGWSKHWQQLAAQGYDVDESASRKSTAEVRRFLVDWQVLMRPVYMAVSLPDTFQFPEQSILGKLLSEAVLPTCRELDLPLSLMIGVRKRVNPRIRLAGDAVGRADLRALENLCATYPDNRFLVSLLSRENQHELCVYARKFNNLMPFGCWWFLNNPSIVEEITRERIELLGTSFIPQHSDARVLEQVIYKWRNTRATLAPILTDSYRSLCRDGRIVGRQDIERDVKRLFVSNFARWTKQEVN